MCAKINWRELWYIHNICHSLNYYSVVENRIAAIFSSLLLTSSWGLGQKSNIVAKTAFSRKWKFFYYGAVLYIGRSLFQIIRGFFRRWFDYCSLGDTLSKSRNNHFSNLNNKPWCHYGVIILKKTVFQPGKTE